MVYLTDIQRIVDIVLVRSLSGGKELSEEMAEIIARIVFENYEFSPRQCSPSNSN